MPTKLKGWKEMTREERANLNPVEAAEAKQIDARAKLHKVTRQVQRERAKRRQAEQARDTRRKILIGNAVLEALKQHGTTASGVRFRRYLQKLLHSLYRGPEDREILADILSDHPEREDTPPTI